MEIARRTSAILETARQRLNGLISITPKPNLGPNLTPDSFEEAVTGFIARLDSYNQHVAGLDQEQNELEAAEVTLREQNRRILSAVEAQYGPDSSEYEKVGGKRQSERKRGAKQNTGCGLFTRASLVILIERLTRHSPVCDGGAAKNLHRPVSFR